MNSALLFHRAHVGLQVEIISPLADFPVLHFEDTHTGKIDISDRTPGLVHALTEHHIAALNQVYNFPFSLGPGFDELGDEGFDGGFSLHRLEGHIVVAAIFGEIGGESTGVQFAPVSDELPYNICIAFHNKPLTMPCSHNKT